MVKKYKEKGKCWSNYLKFCLDHGTLTIHNSLQVPEVEKKSCIQKLKKLVEKQLIPTSCDNQSTEASAVAGLHRSRRKLVPSNSLFYDPISIELHRVGKWNVCVCVYVLCVWMYVCVCICLQNHNR